MAKLERRLKGDFHRILREIDNAVLHGSATASLEDGADYSAGDVLCAVRVYERYSMMGGNRVSLNVTLLGSGGEVRLIAIASGGSQAMFFKVNTFGESAFLDQIRGVADRYGE